MHILGCKATQPVKGVATWAAHGRVDVMAWERFPIKVPLFEEITVDWFELI